MRSVKTSAQDWFSTSNLNITSSLSWEPLRFYSFCFIGLLFWSHSTFSQTSKAHFLELLAQNFTGGMWCMSSNQQRQSTEGYTTHNKLFNSNQAKSSEIWISTFHGHKLDRLKALPHQQSHPLSAAVPVYIVNNRSSINKSIIHKAIMQ